MSVPVSFDTLLDYSDHERGKWRAWFTEKPARLELPFQPGARFVTVGALLDHVFLVERRHLSRLEGATPPDATGIPLSDGKAMFDYADLVRADLRTYLRDLDAVRAGETMTIVLPTGTFAMTRLKLATHIVLHEVRHLAQIAFVARAAGEEPPGTHDLFYCPEVG